ncbi:hypothetical protein [Flavobacterium sp.]|uniref:hypothetical protein n=1 Tax=Flavobacterium sp. TaxID=239 RepID=UPI00391C08DF
MKTVLAKKSIFEVIFILCVVIPYFDNFELTIATWSIAALFTVQNTYSLGLIKQLFFFLGIFIFALVVTFFNEHQPFYVLRDITYMIKPCIGIVLGYQLCKKINSNIFNIIVKTGFVFSLIHLFFLVRGVVFFKVLNINDLRFFGGFFSDFEVFALIVILFHKRFEVTFSPQKIRWYTAIIALSVFLYLARTNFIQLGILLLALKGLFVANKRNVTILVTVAIVTIIGYSSILVFNPKRNGPGMEAFLYKIKIIPEEAFKTKVNRNDWKAFNDNYRSYENIMTVRQVTGDGFYSIAFGQGLGSKVDLKEELQLGDMKLRYISILHNGYMTVFLKSGLIGVLLLLFSLGIYFRKTSSEITIIKQIDLLLLGMGIFMIMSYWVFMGFYFKADNKIILLGALICYKEIIMSKRQKVVQND